MGVEAAASNRLRRFMKWREEVSGMDRFAKIVKETNIVTVAPYLFLSTIGTATRSR
jgi:hypothetical protein